MPLLHSIHFCGRVVVGETEPANKTKIILSKTTSIRDVWPDYIARVMGGLRIVLTLTPSSLVISLPQDLHGRAVKYMGHILRPNGITTIRPSRGIHDLTVVAPDGSWLGFDIFLGTSQQADDLVDLPEDARYPAGATPATSMLH